MALDPVKIPADVQVEEKIFGPVSLRQIIILMATGGLSYVLWALAKQNEGINIVVTALCWSPLVIGAAFAFVRINDISLLKFLFLMTEKSQKSSIRVFGPRTGINIAIRTKVDPKKEAERIKKEREKEAKTRKNEQSMSELSELLDTGLRDIVGAAPAAHAPDETEIQAMEAMLTETEAEEEAPHPPTQPVDPSRIETDPPSSSNPDIPSAFDGIFGDDDDLPPAT